VDVGKSGNPVITVVAYLRFRTDKSDLHVAPPYHGS
jgi:hypothetical protein